MPELVTHEERGRSNGKEAGAETTGSVIRKRHGDCWVAARAGRAGSGPLGAMRAVHERGDWPPNLDLFVVSDVYGLVDLLDPQRPDLAHTFFASREPGWWADFVGHNLDRVVKTGATRRRSSSPTPSMSTPCGTRQTARDRDCMG